MKKVLIALSVVATMGLSANAQNDAFFSYNTPSDGYRETTTELATPMFPQRGVHQDQPAPLGSGLLLLAGMGVAYAMRRKKSE